MSSISASLSEYFFVRSIGPDRFLIIDILAGGTEAAGYHLFEVDHDNWKYVAHLGDRDAAVRFESYIELIEERAA